MRSFLSLVVILTAASASAQYYYKDIIGGNETTTLLKLYQNNKVSKVLLTSYDASNTKNNDFYVEQELTPFYLKTTTRSNITNESILTSFIENGKVIKTVDSSETILSTTTYRYNDRGQLISAISFSSDTGHSANESEQHLWEYNNNIPVRMLRIKNGRDTAYIQLKSDANGNIIEEDELHKGLKPQPTYYYYDGNNRMTDIVQFNKRANRLLPEYMFEYSASNQVIQQITVPANNSDYLIWRYQYNEKGLKVKEAVYNKQKQLNGTITYEYIFGS